MNDSTVSKINRRWVLGTARDDPGGLCLTRSHFASSDAQTPSLSEGEILVKAGYFSPDPMNHAWVRRMQGKFEPLPVGSAMRGGVSGCVVASRHAGWRIGDAVAEFFWIGRTIRLAGGLDHMGVPVARTPDGVGLASGLSTLDMTGVCAWLGLGDIGRTEAGDTMLVSGTSGSMGSMAGQIAKLFGAHGRHGRRRRELCFRILGGIRRRGGLSTGRSGGPNNRGFSRWCGCILRHCRRPPTGCSAAQLAPRGRSVISGAVAHYSAQPTPIFNHIQLALRSVTLEGLSISISGSAGQWRATCAMARRRVDPRSAR